MSITLALTILITASKLLLGCAVCVGVFAVVPYIVVAPSVLWGVAAQRKQS